MHKVVAFLHYIPLSEILDLSCVLQHTVYDLCRMLQPLPDTLMAKLSQPPRRCLCSVHVWQRPPAPAADAVATLDLRRNFQGLWDAWVPSLEPSKPKPGARSPQAFLCNGASIQSHRLAVAHAANTEEGVAATAAPFDGAGDVSISQTSSGFDHASASTGQEGKRQGALGAQHLCSDAPAFEHLSQALSSQVSTQASVRDALFGCSSQLASQASTGEVPPDAAAGSEVRCCMREASQAAGLGGSGGRTWGAVAWYGAGAPAAAVGAAAMLNTQLELSPENSGKHGGGGVSGAEEASAGKQPRKRRQGLLGRLRAHEEQPCRGMAS